MLDHVLRDADDVTVVGCKKENALSSSCKYRIYFILGKTEIGLLRINTLHQRTVDHPSSTLSSKHGVFSPEDVETIGQLCSEHRQMAAFFDYATDLVSLYTHCKPTVIHKNITLRLCTRFCENVDDNKRLVCFHAKSAGAILKTSDLKL